MFLRMVTHAIRKEDGEKMAKAYKETVQSALRSTKGCVFASLLQNVLDEKECVSLTIWKSQQESLAYEESGLFPQLVNILRPFFIESDEWKLELSADLSLEYTQVQNEPSVKHFTKSVADSGFIGNLRATPFAVLLLPLFIHENKFQEFERIFSVDVFPVFKGTKGFIDLILIGQNNEYYVLSIWDETVDILSPTGKYSIDTLYQSIDKKLPPYVQWHGSQKGPKYTLVSGVESKASLYRCLTSEWF